MLTTRVRDESGFTLIEAAVAMLLLVIGVLGSVSVFDSSRRESATGERLQVAQALAEAELERMRDVPYAELATDGAGTWPESGGAGDPAGRVVEGTEPQFRASEDLGEPLALAAAGAGIDPYSEPEEVTVAGSSFEMQVYRFVSWRDVECQVADLSDLKAGYEDLLAQLSTRLNNIAGTGGRLDQLVALPIARLPNAVRNRLNQLDPITNELRTAILSLIDTVEELDEIDPCDADIESLNELGDALSALAPTLDALDAALSNYQAGCFSVLGLPIVCPGTGSALHAAVNTQITELQNHNYVADVQGIISALDEVSSADHVYNTKRVTAAVVLTPVNGSGPFKPVWATSIVSDPEAGLLSG